MPTSEITAPQRRGGEQEARPLQSEKRNSDELKAINLILPTPNQQPVHWTSYLSALSTPTIAIFGAFIAYRQWRTGMNKLKLDLFEKRFAIFEAARKVIAESTKHRQPKDEDLYAFLAAITGVKWLFNQEIADYLYKELWGQLIDLQTLTEELQELPDNASQADRAKIAKQRGEIKKQLWSQFENLENKMAPFLQLSH